MASEPQPNPAYETRLPPQALDVEVAVLGAMMLDNACCAEVFGILDPQDFYKPAHAKIYAAMYRLAERSDPIDMATVATELENSGELIKAGGPCALIDIADSVLTVASAPKHAAIVKQKAVLRLLAGYASQLSTAIHEHPGNAAELVAEAQGRLLTIGAGLTPGRGRSVAMSVCMNDIVAEEVDWLWEPYIPKGALTILEGDPGVGKTFLALQFISILSRGWAFPDHQTGTMPVSREPMSSIYMTAEDGLANTLRPRLDRAGADCRLVHAITGIQGAPGTRLAERQITLRDIPELEAAIERVRPGLVVVDPLQAYIGPDVDLAKSNETRPVLSGLAMLAERQRVSILLIRHLTKGSPGKAIYRGLGGMDLLGAARSALLAGEDPDDEHKRVIAQIKMNLAPKGQSIGYTLDADGFHWTGVSTVTAEQMNAAGTRPQRSGQGVNDAVEWLENTLANGAIASNEVYARAQQEHVGRDPLRTAKQQLHVEAIKQGAIWVWRLPAQP